MAIRPEIDVATKDQAVPARFLACSVARRKYSTATLAGAATPALRPSGWGSGSDFLIVSNTNNEQDALNVQVNNAPVRQTKIAAGSYTDVAVDTPEPDAHSSFTISTR